MQEKTDLLILKIASTFDWLMELLTNWLSEYWLYCLGQG